MVTAGEGLFPGTWHEHVSLWLANPFASEMLIVKYEDLQRAPLEELQRLCDFAGLERSEAELSRAIAGASFSKMREKEESEGWENPSWPTEKPFIRRGETGSYLDEMPPEVLYAFMKVAAETLAVVGYSVTPTGLVS